MGERLPQDTIREMVVRGVPSFAMAVASLLLCLPLPSHPSMTPSSLETCKKKPDVGMGPCTTLSAVRGLLPGHKDSVNCITMNDVRIPRKDPPHLFSHV